MKFLGVIQARMNSSRLPGKVMMPIAEKPLIEHIYNRIKTVNSVNQVIVITTDHFSNNQLKLFLDSKGIQFYSHTDENDISGRLYNACSMYEFDYVLKINSDCPLIDPLIINNLLAKILLQKQVDFACNHFVSSFPLGYSFEFLSKSIINWCNENLRTKHDREYMINWIKNNKSKFKTLSMQNKTNLSKYSLTVDTPKDYELIKLIFLNLYNNNNIFGMNEVIKLISEKSFSKFF